MTLPKSLQTPTLRELMRRLRKHAPLSVPVRLVQRRGVRCWGEEVLGVAWTLRRDGRSVRYRIVVDSRLSRAEKWEVIVHEWAHCLDRETRARSRDCHDSRWGQHYSRAFRASINPE